MREQRECLPPFFLHESEKCLRISFLPVNSIMLSTRPIATDRTEMLWPAQRMIGWILLLFSICAAIAHAMAEGWWRCRCNRSTERRWRRSVWRRRWLEFDLVERDYRSTPTAQRAQGTARTVVHRLDRWEGVCGRWWRRWCIVVA